PRVAFFDHRAAAWDQQMGGNTAQVLRRLDALRDRLGLRPGVNVLEIGCGTGLITGWLVESVRPGRVVAADFSPAMLAQARAKHIDADFRQMDICSDLPETDAFDLVWCFQCFPHFRNHPAALRNIAHGLKPEGRLVVLHLQGSRQMNEFHRQVGGAVHADLLPPADRWPRLLSLGGLQLAGLEDRDDLFLLEARKLAL
ncbi:MAG: methyltransferase domain-containing protein, partial [Verrucomicrobiae bacterium]|nr:methyltransferase domain-containing protein [Verrucomicrobiae bacterium]